MIPFVGFPKITRYSRDCVITEKIDGTNAQVWIPTDEERAALPEKWQALPFIVGSRTRWLYPPGDNHGFSFWAYANQSCLLELGPGHHFGEWWGQGIQRNYGLKEKRFSLFNVSRWTADRPSCCGVVPTLWRGIFGTISVEELLDEFCENGSLAVPGFMKPEGIVIYHIASGVSFKKTLERDEKPKGIVHDPI
jgi:hypothetical protein